MQGWIKLHRELFEKAIWRKTTSKQKAILITILLMANHKPAKWIFNGELCECDAGQFITSLKSIQENCGKDVSIKNIRTALELFEKLEFLANKSTKAGRLITIVNYKTYQALNDENGKDEGNEPAKVGQRAGKEVATNNNVNNVNNVKNENNVNKYIADFEKFWSLYPKRTGKGAALESWKKINPNKELFEKICSAVNSQKTSDQWTRDNGQFIPYPATWLNQKRWDDDLFVKVEPAKSAAEIAFENIIREREKNGQ
jgi:hypothetical protein